MTQPIKYHIWPPKLRFYLNYDRLYFLYSAYKPNIMLFKSGQYFLETSILTSYKNVTTKIFYTKTIESKQSYHNLIVHPRQPHVYPCR